jgi:hypothetical protein
MFGQGCFVGVVDFGVVDFCAGVGVVGVVGVVAALDSVVVVELGAAAAPAMPEAAPPAASAPAIIVAPSILDICMGWDLLGEWMVCVSSTMLRATAKPTRRRS